MSDEPENIVLHLLREIREDVKDTRDEVRAIRRTQTEHRMTRLEIATARLARDRASDAKAEAERGLRLDGMDERITRIERRLELCD